MTFIVLGSTGEGVKLGRLCVRASSGMPGSRSSAKAVASLPRSNSWARKMKLHWIQMRGNQT